jgi:hypothetical protein
MSTRAEALREAEKMADEHAGWATDPVRRSCLEWFATKLAKRAKEAEASRESRTCSTCRHLAWAKIENYAGRSAHCSHDRSAVLDLSSEMIGAWGCSLWQPAAPETKGESQ